MEIEIGNGNRNAPITGARYCAMRKVQCISIAFENFILARDMRTERDTGVRNGKRQLSTTC